MDGYDVPSCEDTCLQGSLRNDGKASRKPIKCVKRKSAVRTSQPKRSRRYAHRQGSRICVFAQAKSKWSVTERYIISNCPNYTPAKGGKQKRDNEKSGAIAPLVHLATTKRSRPFG